jgi:hypothetical protein
VQWQRRLWDVGLVVALRELREACDAEQSDALSKQSVKWLATSIEHQVANDPGAGEGEAVKRLRSLLKADLTSGGSNYRELIAWTDEIGQEYLRRWRVRAASLERPSREQLARALATHLLGEGFSTAYLRYAVKHLDTSAKLDAGQLVDEMGALATLAESSFAVMAVFGKSPPKRFSRPREWNTAAETSRWLSANGFAPVRQHGGLLLKIDARDPYAAALLAAEIIDRLEARAAVGSRDGLMVHPELFVAGLPDPLPRRNSRRAEVRALEREDALLRLDQGGPVDQSLELLSHLNTSPDAVAAAAGWSAIESLLSGPGDEDRVVTADRLANLVSCSWPRAELTTIAWARIYQAGKQSDRVADELRALSTNRERADRILDALRSGEAIDLHWPSEKLALKRMEKLVKSPRDQLLAVQRRAAGCLRRLYRQRNLVVHGGQTAGFSLSVALRLAAPLVGAGLDRITHASLVDGRHPQELAARAQMEIHHAGTTRATPITALLE